MVQSQAARADLKEDRRRAAIVHMGLRIKTLESMSKDRALTATTRGDLHRRLDFLSKVRDTTLHNLDRSLGALPTKNLDITEIPKHHLDTELASDEQPAAPQEQSFDPADMSFLA